MSRFKPIFFSFVQSSKHFLVLLLLPLFVAIISMPTYKFMRVCEMWVFVMECVYVYAYISIRFRCAKIADKIYIQHPYSFFDSLPLLCTLQVCAQRAQTHNCKVHCIWNKINNDFVCADITFRVHQNSA